MWDFSMVCLIPARAGSQRIPGKNTRELAGHPLIAYTIAAALDSGVFTNVVVCTDDQWLISVLLQRDEVDIFGRKPVADDQADIVWVRDALKAQTPRPEAFAILRPTSPFRTADTIRRAFKQFTLPDQTADSIRAVQPVKEHPGKMWTWSGRGYAMTPAMPYFRPDGVPWHSSPTQSLPTYYVQNSSLEMAYTANVETHGTIHGKKVIPFLTEGYEGLSIDYPGDFERAESLAASGAAVLPAVPVARVSTVSPVQ